MDGFGVAANSMFPWVDQGDAARAEITDIARDHRESMHQGRGSDQRIAFIGLVGNMQAGTTQCHRGIDRQDSGFECRHDVTRQPAAHQLSLNRITPFHSQYSGFQFFQSNGGNVQARGDDAFGPTDHIGIGG